MGRTCLAKNTNTYEQCHASPVQPLKNNSARIKITLKILCFLLPMFFIGCSGNQSLKQKPRNEEVKTSSVTSLRLANKQQFKDSTVAKNLSNDELYVFGENRRDSSTQLEASPSTQKRSYTNKMGDNTRQLYIKYNHGLIVVIVDRILDKNDKQISNSVYCFDKDNRCLYVDYWNNVSKMSYTFDMTWGNLIKYNAKYEQISMTETEKQEIIQKTKSSLDEIMHHFPEFQYSFDWK